MKLHNSPPRRTEPQNNPPPADRISKGGFAMLSLFYKKMEYLPSKFDIRYSLFDTYSPPLEDSLFKVSFIDQTGRFSGRRLGCLPCAA
jgi:hypothetical protein